MINTFDVGDSEQQGGNTPPWYPYLIWFIGPTRSSVQWKRFVAMLSAFNKMFFRVEAHYEILGSNVIIWAETSYTIYNTNLCEF